MDPAHTAVLGSAGYFIHLYTPLFYRAFHSISIGMGSCLGYALQKEETKDLIFSFHDTAGYITLGYFKDHCSSELVNSKGNINTFQKP
jgi:hypothetical protein